MGVFKKTSKYRKLSTISEKEKFLNAELVKTGMLDENAPANSTSSVYSMPIEQENEKYAAINAITYGGQNIVFHHAEVEGGIKSPDGKSTAMTNAGMSQMTKTRPGWRSSPQHRMHGTVIWYWDPTMDNPPPEADGGWRYLEWGVNPYPDYQPGFGYWTSGALGFLMHSNENVPADLKAALADYSSAEAQEELKKGPTHIVLDREGTNDMFNPYPGNKDKEKKSEEEEARAQLGLGQSAWNWLKDQASDILDKGREFGDNLDKSIEGAIDSAIDWAQDASQDVKDWVEESIDKGSPLWEYKDAIGDGINALDNWVDNNITDRDGTKRQIFTDFGEAVSNVLSEAAKDFFNYDAETASNFMSDMNQHALDMKDNPNTPGSSMDNRKDQSDRVSDSDMNALNDVVNSDEYKNEVDDYRNGTGNYENLSKDEARAKLQEELVGSEGKNGMLEQVIYDRPGLDNSLHNGVQIDIDHLEETGETKLNKTYDFNEGGSVEDAEENPYFYAYSQVMNLPADAFGTGAVGGAVGLYAKYVGLSNADMYNGINEMPPMHYSVTVSSRDNNKNESFIVESKNYTPLGSSKIKKNVKEYKKTLKHGRFNLFDFMPGFDNPPPKKKVKESYLSEGWHSPEHVNVDKNERKRWFNPKDIQPEYPEKAPPEQVDGWHPDLKKKEETPISIKQYIKIKEVDLIKNHKLKDKEVKEFMNTINAINFYLTKNPSALVYAQQRYPRTDPHLAALNYKMDTMLAASKEFMDKKYPENTRLFNQLQKSVKRSIKLTDPTTFKVKLGNETSYKKLLSVNYVENIYDKVSRTEKKVKRKKNKKSASRFFRKEKPKTKSELIDLRLKQLEIDMQKTLTSP